MKPYHTFALAAATALAFAACEKKEADQKADDAKAVVEQKAGEAKSTAETKIDDAAASAKEKAPDAAAVIDKTAAQAKEAADKAVDATKAAADKAADAVKDAAPAPAPAPEPARPKRRSRTTKRHRLRILSPGFERGRGFFSCPGGSVVPKGSLLRLERHFELLEHFEDMAQQGFVMLLHDQIVRFLL